MNIKVKKMVMLYNGRTVDCDLYDTAFQLAKGAIDYLLTCDLLDGREEFTTEMLCGEEQWKLWTDVEKQTAGRCLVSMARMNILPLEVVECADGKHSSPARFRIKK